MFIALGLLGLYLIYRIEFRWYTVTLAKMNADPTSGPEILLNPLAHYIFHAVIILSFCASTFCFYKVNPWFVLISPIILVVFWIGHIAIRAREKDRVIALAATIVVAERRKGSSRLEINDAICLATLGKDCELGTDCDAKALLKFTILPKLGLFTTRPSMALAGSDSKSHVVQLYMEECAEIDTKFEDAVRRGKNKRKSSSK